MTTANEVYYQYTSPTSESEARPGDLVFFENTYSLESITLFWSPWGSKDSGCSKIKIAKVKACCYSTFTLAIYCFMDFATNVKKKRKSAPYC